MNDPERFQGAVFGFVAELARRIGEEPSVLTVSEDRDSTIVICENGNVYRVRMAIRFDSITAEIEPEVEG